jgi:hypothetical protein
MTPAQEAAQLGSLQNKYLKFGMDDGQGGVRPLSPVEARQFAEIELTNPDAMSDPIFQDLRPLPRGAQREFTWRDIFAEKARRRQADQFGAKTEAEIDAEVAADFGMTVPEMRDMMRQRTSSGGMPVVQGSAPPAPSATFGPPAPAQAQGQRGFYTDDNGQQIPGVMMPDGTFLPD